MRVTEIYTYPNSHITFQGRQNVRHLVESDGNDPKKPFVRMTLVPELNALRVEKYNEKTSYVPMTSIMEFYLHEEPRQSQAKKAS